MRFLAIAAFASLASGCAELGVIHDGTSISLGRPNRGRIVDGVRLPNRGDGFMTRSMWQSRGNRYGTDELVDLITAVSRRLVVKTNGVRLVVADLSGRGGGESKLWHRSHQSGRDVDLLYFVRDADGKPVEPEVMHVFTPDGSAKDGSGLHVDVPRTWHLVRELVTAPEATVQWVFMYEPIATKLLEYAQQTGEPEALILRARKALKQPGDSAPHNDHMHVRVYCSVADRAYGCQDIGQRELLAEREQELAAQTDTIVAALGGSANSTSRTASSSGAVTPASWSTAASAVMPPAPVALPSIGRRLLRTRSHRLDLRRWR